MCFGDDVIDYIEVDDREELFELEAFLFKETGQDKRRLLKNMTITKITCNCKLGELKLCITIMTHDDAQAHLLQSIIESARNISEMNL